ncbi:MAG: hypothetical protein WKG06_43820 [Segetibacter sp.]
MTEQEFKNPLSIPNDAFVYRQVNLAHLKHELGNRKKRFPKESHFKPDADGLSVHWNRFIDVKGIYHIIGISFKPETTEFKDYRTFRVFSFPINFLKEVDGINSIIHSPVFNGNPAPVGFPNNYAHSSILYPDDEEIRIKLSTYCNEKYAECFCPTDLNLLDIEINPLRERLNQTEYHLL